MRSITRRRRALTLVETIVALAIFSVVSLAVLTAIHQSIRGLKTTSDHTVAMLLTQKVVDEVLQDSLDSPFFREDLDAAVELTGPIRDSGSPFFQVIEDTAPPWGRMDPAMDMVIDPAFDPDLYRLYGRIELGLSHVEMPLEGAGGGLVRRLEVLFRWPGFDGKLRDSRQAIHLPMRPSESTRLSELSMTDLDGVLARAFYPGLEGTLAERAARRGADVEAVRRAGRLIWLLRESHRLVGEPAPAAVVADADPSAPWIRRAQQEERKALHLFEILVSTSGPAQDLEFRPADFDLRSPVIERAYVSLLLRRASTSLREVERQLAMSVEDYVRGWHELHDRGLRAYRRLAIEKKVLDLTFFRSLISEDPDLDFAQAWLDMMEEEYRQRSWILESYVTRKKGSNLSLARLRSTYPAATGRVRSAREATEAFGRIDRLLQIPST